MPPDQIILIGLIASAITFVLRILATYANFQPGRILVNVVLFVVSAILAVVWSVAAWPAFPSWGGDIVVFVTALWQWLNDVVAVAAPIVGSATLIYNLLYEKVVLPLKARFAKK